MAMNPGKGVRVPLTLDLVEHIGACMDELQEILDAFTQSPDIDQLVANFAAKGWQHSKDKYGHCFETDFDYSDQNLFKIKVVIDDRMQAKIDFRDWWERN